MLVSGMAVVSAVGPYTVPVSGARLLRSVTLRVRSAHSPPVPAAMLTWKVLVREPVLAILMVPVWAVQPDHTPLMVMTALHQLLPVEIGVAVSERQLVLLACARVPAATLLPAFSV